MPNNTFHLTALNRQICRLVLGTAHLVFSDQRQADALYDAFVGLGGNCLDTAPNYLDAELTIGSWLKRRGNREQVVVSTKGGTTRGAEQKIALHARHRRAWY